MKNIRYILLLAVCLLVGFIAGRLTNSNIELNSDSNNTTNSVSFNKTFIGLDNSNAIWSNVEKSEINNAKRDMIAARNLYMINQIILNSDNTRSKWRSEKYAWDQLSNDINQFMSAKMTEQWETGKTGTAGSSYCDACRNNLETIRAILLESLFNGPEFSINDKSIISNHSYVSTQVSPDYIVTDLSNDVFRYLDDYISNEFYEWRDESISLIQWRTSTSELITSLKNHLNDYIKISFDAFDSAYPHRAEVRLKWILQQILQIIKKGD